MNLSFKSLFDIQNNDIANCLPKLKYQDLTIATTTMLKGQRGFTQLTVPTGYKYFTGYFTQSNSGTNNEQFDVSISGANHILWFINSDPTNTYKYGGTFRALYIKELI